MSNFSAFWQKRVVGVVNGAWCFSKRLICGTKVSSKASYFGHVFRLGQNKFRKWSISSEKIRKLFFTCPEKKSSNIGFSKKNRILSKNISTFYWNNFQRFFKTTLYMSSGKHCGKTFFVRKINISFLVTSAKVFGNLAKTFQQGCQNCLPRDHREPMKKWFSEKNLAFAFLGFWATIFDIMAFFWVTVVKKMYFLGVQRTNEKNGNLNFFSRCRTFS